MAKRRQNDAHFGTFLYLVYVFVWLPGNYFLYKFAIHAEWDPYLAVIGIFVLDAWALHFPWSVRQKEIHRASMLKAKARELNFRHSA